MKYLNTFTFVLASFLSLNAKNANADTQIIQIEAVNSASISGSSTWSCCTMSNLSSNPSSISTKNCEVLGGYCMGSKRFGIWVFEKPVLPEGATVITTSFSGQRSGATGYGNLKFMSVDNTSIDSSNGQYLFSSGLNQNINWSSNSIFGFTLSNSAFDLMMDSNYFMVGAYQSSTSSMTINNSSNAPILNILIDIPAEDCVADINSDGYVNVSDVLQLIAAWGDCSTKDCPADLNGDYSVNVIDLLELIDAWGSC